MSCTFFTRKKIVVFFTDAITNGVPVYFNDTGTDTITIIKEYPEKENWHDVELLRQSSNRYKVRISAINENNVAPIMGWVDKEQCGVWLWGKWIKPEFCIVSLYRMPGQLYPFVKIIDKYAHGFDKVAKDSPIKGAHYHTSYDENKGHSISSFYSYINQLPEGKYKVIDGQIVKIQ